MKSKYFGLTTKEVRKLILQDIESYKEQIKIDFSKTYQANIEFVNDKASKKEKLIPALDNNKIKILSQDTKRLLSIVELDKEKNNLSESKTSTLEVWISLLEQNKDYSSETSRQEAKHISILKEKASNIKDIEREKQNLRMEESKYQESLDEQKSIQEQILDDMCCKYDNAKSQFWNPLKESIKNLFIKSKE